MKTIFISLFLVFGIGQAKAQSFIKYADTANYLIHQIENKKKLFIGKPFSVLLDSLKIQPVFASSGNSGAKGNTFGETLFFDFNYEKEFVKAHYIIVDFINPPLYEQVYPIFYPLKNRNLQSIISAYKNVIVKDVLVKDYNGGDYIDPDVHY